MARVRIWIILLCSLLIFIAWITWQYGFRGELSRQLFPAVEAGDSARVKRLLRKGADVNITRDYTETPLMVAIRLGKEPTIQALLAAKPVRHVEVCPGEATEDMVEYAASHGDPVTFDLLRSHYRKSDNQELLMCAAEAGNHTIVTKLLSEGTNPNYVSRHTGSVPLAVAESGKVITILLHHGANPNITMNDGSTPLHWAWKPDVVRALLAGNVNVNARNASGQTPLHQILMNHGHGFGEQAQVVESVQLLLAHGAVLNVRDQYKKTPLVYADQELIEMLAQKVKGLPMPAHK